MKSMLLRSLYASLAVLVLACAWQLSGGDAALAALPQRVVSGTLAVLVLASVFGWLLRRVRSEDRLARHEATLCRVQNARSQADQALAEADLLLSRLTARNAGPESLRVRGERDGQLSAQLVQVQAELAQLQQNTALDVVSAARLARARDRLEQVARIVRNAARAAEPG